MLDELMNKSQDLVKMMINEWNLLLIFLVWIGLHTLQERFSEIFEKPKIGWRLLPFLPALFTVPACFVPGPWFPADLHPTAGMRVLMGLMLAFAAYNFGGIANRLGLPALANKAGIGFLVEKTTRKHAPDKVEDPPATSPGG